MWEKTEAHREHMIQKSISLSPLWPPYFLCLQRFHTLRIYDWILSLNSERYVRKTSWTVLIWLFEPFPSLSLLFHSSRLALAVFSFLSLSPAGIFFSSPSLPFPPHLLNRFSLITPFSCLLPVIKWQQSLVFWFFFSPLPLAQPLRVTTATLSDIKPLAFAGPPSWKCHFI